MTNYIQIFPNIDKYRYILNIILAMSNILGFIPLFLIKKKCVYISRLLLLLIVVSTTHHLLETNEMNHNLEGIHIPILYNYGYYIRYMDISIAVSLFLYIVKFLGIYNTIHFININIKILMLSCTASFLCDFIISNSPYMYFLLHMVWHIGIYYILYKLSIINKAVIKL